MWFDDTPDSRVGTDRVKELLETGAETIVVSCPFCLTMIGDGLSADNGIGGSRGYRRIACRGLGRE
jgi:Fe-S oxidoreductase